MADANPPRVYQPIIIDLGKKRRKRIKQLKRGRGKLMNEVHYVIEEVQADLGKEAEGKEFIPIVMIYRRRRRRKKGGGLGLPVPFPPFFV